MKTVLKQQAEPEVDDQEYPDRQQGKGIAFFSFCSSFCQHSKRKHSRPILHKDESVGFRSHFRIYALLH